MPTNPHLKKKELAFWIILATSLIFGCLIRLQSPEATWFNLHMSRDLSRAFQWLDGNPVLLGPEMNYGHQLPGPFYYLVLAVLWPVVGSIGGISNALQLLSIVLIGVFTIRLVRPLGMTAAVGFWLAFSLMPAQVLIARTLWNPCLILPLNLLYLLFADAYLKSKNRWFLAAFYVVGIASLQIHFSLILGLVMGTVWIGINSEKWPRECGVGLLCCVLYCLGVWGATIGYESYLLSLKIQYAGLGETDYPAPEYQWSKFGRSLDFHLFVQEQPLVDYELYLGPWLYLPTLDAQAHSALKLFVSFSPLFKLLLFVGYGRLFWKLIKSRFRLSQLDRLEQLVFLWLVPWLAVLLFYRVKGGLFPYRYGFCIYPIHFLVVPILIRDCCQPGKHWKALKVTILGVSALLFLGNAYFIHQHIRVCKEVGKYQQGLHNYFELSLEKKMELLKTIDLSVPPEQFCGTLHGGLANRMRNFEFDHWEQSRWSGGLIESLKRSGQISQQPDNRHYYLRATSPNEPAGPFEKIRLENSDLPQDPLLIYKDTQGIEIGREQLKTGDQILPGLKAPTGVAEIVVSFELLSSKNPELMIWYDAHPGHRALRLLEVKLEDAVTTYQRFGPLFLEQAADVVEVPKGATRCELRFKAYYQGRYHRLDIFRNPDSVKIHEPLPEKSFFELAD